MKYLLGLGGLAALFAVALLLSFYNVWAWGYVILWFSTGWVVNYFPALVVTADSAKIIALSFAIVSGLLSLWNIQKSEPDDREDKEGRIAHRIGVCAVALVAPWFTMFGIWLNLWWFAL